VLLALTFAHTVVAASHRDLEDNAVAEGWKPLGRRHLR